MSVDLRGICRSKVVGMGNKLFQFFTALIYAEKHNLYLNITDPQFNIVAVDLVEFNKDKLIPTNLEAMTLSSGHFDENDDLRFFGDKHYIITDYFQNANYLNNNSDIIFKYTKTHIHHPPKFAVDPNDLLCYVRLGDLKFKELIHPDFFLEVIRENKFNKIYFIFYPGNDEDIEKYLHYFREYKDEIICIQNNDPFIDFSYVNYFKNIAVTTSTFYWWSLFFAEKLEEKKVYTSKYFGQTRFNERRNHVKNLGNVRNLTIQRETHFIDPAHLIPSRIFI